MFMLCDSVAANLIKILDESPLMRNQMPNIKLQNELTLKIDIQEIFTSLVS